MKRRNSQPDVASSAVWIPAFAGIVLALRASAGAYRPRNLRASPLYHCVARHAGELRAAGRLERPVEKQAIERFVECGDPHYGFARIRCDACGHDDLPGSSCKTRYFCPSCHQKRVLLYGEWVEENILVRVADHHIVRVPEIIALLGLANANR